MKIKAKTYNGTGTFKYAHHKLDGIWITARRRVRDRSLVLETPTPVDLADALEYSTAGKLLNQAIRDVDTVWHGELHVPGRAASYVKSAIAQCEDSVRFTAFAGGHLSDAMPLENVAVLADMAGLDFAPFVVNPDVAELIAAGPPEGCEGYVFKNGNALDWTKWKPVNTVDCRVTGVTEGRGKHLGLVGALRVSVWTGDAWQEIANVSGMTDEERADMSVNSPIDKIVEVAYQYVGEGGRLRHPRFIRFRDDKALVDCVL